MKDETFDERTAIIDSWLTKTGGYAKDMSLRDYFAAKAMQGLMVRNWSNHKGTDEELIGVWARSSYAVADAMLERRHAAQ